MGLTVTVKVDQTFVRATVTLWQLVQDFGVQIAAILQHEIIPVLQPHLCLWDIGTTMGYTSMRYTSMALYFYEENTQVPNKFF